MADQPVRVAIISRQEMVARGMIAMLMDYPERVIVVALPSVRSRATGVDVVIYDTIGLHNSDGGDLDHLIHRTDASVLVMARDMRPDLRARALAQGATAWISQSAHAAELVEAVELTAAGKPLPDQEERLGQGVGLSAREVEILALIAQGFTNQEILDKLHLTINTLKSHIRSTYRKIGASSRSQAVAWAMQNGFAPPDAGAMESGIHLG